MLTGILFLSLKTYDYKSTKQSGNSFLEVHGICVSSESSYDVKIYFGLDPVIAYKDSSLSYRSGFNTEAVLLDLVLHVS